MEEAKKAGSKETRLKIDPDKFAAAMEKLATDEKLQAKLDENPMDALEELGIDIDKETRDLLKDKSLMEIMGVPKEEEAAARLTPAVVLQPLAKPVAVIQPKSKVISLTGSMSLTRVRTTGPLVRTTGPLVHTTGPVVMTTGPDTMIQTGVVTPIGKKEKAEKKKEKKSK
jgi:hypothetical protein